MRVGRVKKKGRKFFWGICFKMVVGVLFVFSVVVAVFWANGYWYDVAEGDFKMSGIIDLKAKSSSFAKVLINGVEIGERVPLQIKGLVGGEYLIEVKKVGFWDWRRKIEVVEEFVTKTPVYFAMPEYLSLAVEDEIEFEKTDLVGIFRNFGKIVLVNYELKKVEVLRFKEGKFEKFAEFSWIGGEIEKIELNDQSILIRDSKDVWVAGFAGGEFKKLPFGEKFYLYSGQTYWVLGEGFLGISDRFGRVKSLFLLSSFGIEGEVREVDSWNVGGGNLVWFGGESEYLALFSRDGEKKFVEKVLGRPIVRDGFLAFVNELGKVMIYDVLDGKLIELEGEVVKGKLEAVAFDEEVLVFRDGDFLRFYDFEMKFIGQLEMSGMVFDLKEGRFSVLDGKFFREFVW